MESFIGQVAESLYTRYGDGLSSLYILFPSRRARLFFADALSKLTSRPLWQPRYTSIDELMEEISGLRAGDPVRLVTELYKIYRTHHEETFDSFYFWGEMLLSDFDQVDKYLIDADMLFSNISDLKVLESDFSYLSEEQIRIISRFWKSFGLEDEFSPEKQQFVRIWRSLAPIYHAYNDRLFSLSLAYTGMMHRRAAELIREGRVLSPAEPRRYVIAGFNALSECEKILFDYLKNTASVDFFWDYDDYYLKDPDQEAGLFQRENLRRYPSADLSVNDGNAFSSRKEVVAVSAPSDSLQCKYVYDFLEDTARIEGRTPDKETAVVLTDENLLVPVLYSIPESVENVNITMGYPFRQTLAYSFVERLVELQSRVRRRGGRVLFYHADVTGLLTHPFVACGEYERTAREIAAEVLRKQQVYVAGNKFPQGGILADIFSPAEGWQALQEYLLRILSSVARLPYEGEDAALRLEYFSLIADQLHKLRNSLEQCDLDLSVPIFTSLLRRMLQKMTVPYEGEPLSGVQVMGILETRNLDFEHVVILSVNDDTFPGNRAVSSSFIPYNLRLAYGLPTPMHHEGVYAYYFYRLLQRARRVHLVYCSRSDDKRTGEPSRYIYQLKYESPHRVEERKMTVDVNLAPPEPIVVEKRGDVARALDEFLTAGGRTLSPTSFYTYLECPVKFYFHAVARLRKEEELTEEIDSPMFGTILHRAMELLYRPLVGMDNPGPEIRALIRSAKVDDTVNRAVCEMFLKDERADPEEFGGGVLLVRDIVARYINGCLLPYDAGRGDFTIVQLERRIEASFPFGSGAKVCFSGLADRIDRARNGLVRVVDYKTGAPHIEFNGVDALFSKRREERSSAVLQTLLYAMMLNRSEGADVQPSLYYIRNLNAEHYSPLLQDKSLGRPVERYSDYRQEFEMRLKRVLEELFDRDIPFRQCDDPVCCTWCDFREICRR